jgi:hypothetical protein
MDIDHHPTALTTGAGTPAPRGAASTPATMRAVVQHTYGTADALRIETIATPEIADDEVLVKVHAAGLSRGTWHLMTGRPYLLRLAFGLRRPRNRCSARISPAPSCPSGPR